MIREREREREALLQWEKCGRAGHRGLMEGKEPEPEPEPAADDDEDFDDAVYEDNGSEDGEGDEDLGRSDEDELAQEEFVVNGTPMTKEQQLALREKNGFVPASEGLDPSKWKPPHMRLSKFAGRPPTCVFGLGCALDFRPCTLASPAPRIVQSA